MFSKYSSNDFFGTEQVSPDAIRYYAYALLSKAKELDPNIITDNQFEDWKNRFLGLENAFTCTAVLSNTMIDYARAHFVDVINAILPSVWK